MKKAENLIGKRNLIFEERLLEMALADYIENKPVIIKDTEWKLLLL